MVYEACLGVAGGIPIGVWVFIGFHELTSKGI